jgi:transposase-like protein
MAKYSFEIKLEAVLAYLEGKESTREVAKRFNVSKTPLLTWIALYRENGEQGLISSYTNFDIQFKMDVLNYMNEFGASLSQAAAVYNISSPSTIYQWQKQLDRFGLDALLPKKKGRPSMKKETKKSVPVDGSLEALQAENERLRMENAYLKKLQALIQQKKKSPNKTRHK